MQRYTLRLESLRIRLLPIQIAVSIVIEVSRSASIASSLIVNARDTEYVSPGQKPMIAGVPFWA
jgi:hypothetical protein